MLPNEHAAELTAGRLSGSDWLLDWRAADVSSVMTRNVRRSPRLVFEKFGLLHQYAFVLIRTALVIS